MSHTWSSTSLCAYGRPCIKSVMRLPAYIMSGHRPHSSMRMMLGADLMRKAVRRNCDCLLWYVFLNQCQLLRGSQPHISQPYNMVAMICALKTLHATNMLLMGLVRSRYVAVLVACSARSSLCLRAAPQDMLDLNMIPRYMYCED